MLTCAPHSGGNRTRRCTSQWWPRTSDGPLTKTTLEQAKNLVEKGGDWERRNLLGVYDAIYKIISREFKEAADLLIPAVATFTNYKLVSYNTFIFYTVVSSL